MNLRDIEARLSRLDDYYERAMAREPGTDPGGVGGVRVLRQSYDGRPEWAEQVDEHLRRYWPGEFARAG